MNRKRESKIKQELAKELAHEHPFDDVTNWPKGDFQTPPWSREKIADFQKRINSAFGAENAIVLVWSGDRSYGDELYVDWHFNGIGKGRPERKPVLLFGEYKVNEEDYCYIVPPRWCLMEVHHGSQLESSWAESAWISDESFAGGRKQVRPLEVPEFYYVHLRNGVLANHEVPQTRGDVPPCCQRMWQNGRRICYGKYREPNDADIGMIRAIRERMDREGVSQRSDAPRDAKMVTSANLATKHFMQQAAHKRFTAAKDLMLSNPQAFCGDLLTKLGSTKSKVELERLMIDAFEQEEQERFTAEKV